MIGRFFKGFNLSCFPPNPQNPLPFQSISINILKSPNFLKNPKKKPPKFLKTTSTMNSLTSRTKPISQILKSTSRTLFISLFSTSSPSSSPRYIPPHEKRVSEEKQSKSSNDMKLDAKNEILEKSLASSIGLDFGAEKLTSNVVPEKSISEEKHSKSTNALNPAARSESVGNSEGSLGFISKMVNWCKSWRNESDGDKPNEFQSPAVEPSPVEVDARKSDEVPPSEKLAKEASPPKKHDLFTKDSFWSVLQSFFKTQRGSEIVFNALSREQIADMLQKEGLLFLQPLQSIDIHHLVDLLITEKKWIKELPTKNPRFKLVSLYEKSSTPRQPPNPTYEKSSTPTQPPNPTYEKSSTPTQPPNPTYEKSSTPTRPPNPTSLSSIFSNSQSDDNSQLKVSSIAPKKLSEKSRTEVLSDCQKLLDEILSQNPDGFNIGFFKKQFLEKYGYALNHPKLGYPKLVSLFQVLRGVKVEGAQVFRDNVVYSPGVKSLGLKKSTGSGSKVSDSARKDNEVDSLWEELGPVVKADLKRNRFDGEYEPPMPVDDEFSDSEKEEHSFSSNLVKGEEQINSKVDDSLLQILDSRYSTPKTRATRESISRILTAKPSHPRKKSTRQDH